MSGTWQLEHEGRLALLVESMEADGLRVTSNFQAAGEDSPGSRLALFSLPGSLAVLAVFAAAAWTDQSTLTLLCGLILSAAVVVRLWSALSLLALDYRRELSSTHAFPGDTVTLSLTLSNRKWLPLGWAGAQERIPRAVAPADRPIDPAGHLLYGRIGFGTPLGAYETATWSCGLLCRRRGYYPLGTGLVLSGDIFGLYLRGRPSAARLAVTVYPRVYGLAELGLPSRHPLGDSKDPSRLFDDASRARALRDYTPETPFKDIAWGASARHGTLYAKTFDQTITVQTLVLLAVDRFDEAADRNLFELGVSTAASVANQLIEERQRVGLLVNGALAEGRGPTVLPPGRGDAQLQKMLESLARLRRLSTASFGDFLAAQADSLTPGTTLCVVAARLSAADVDRLAAVRRRGCGVLALIVGPGALPDTPLPVRRIIATDLRARPS